MRLGRPGVFALAWAGFLAGALTGLVDGARAAVLVGVDLRAVVLSCVLAASVDALLGLVAMTALGALWRAAAWGRRTVPASWAMASALAVGSAGSAAATVAAFTATLDRHNRFLAGGVTALVMLGVVSLATALAPALARVLSGKRRRPVALDPVEPAALLLVPFVLMVGGAMVVTAAVRGRLPSVAPATRQLVIQVAFVAAFLPALVSATERLPLRLRFPRPALVAALAYGGTTVAFVVARWSDNLRFLPWSDVLAGAAIVVGAVGFASWRAARPASPRKLRRVGRVVALAAAVASTLAASEAESARKAMTRAGLVAPVLARARLAFDFDHDGYARLLGGGDCDDGDASIHPGVIDFPDDGVDEDCDGRDATVSVIAPRPFAAVPDAVPRDLNLLLITIDTLRADHLGSYGYARPTSPNLDELARDSGFFANGFAHAPSTRYSMPAIATARWPSAITWDESIWWPRIAPSMRTMAESLKAAGYVTGAFYSFDYFSPGDHRGFERGVDFYRADRATLHRAVNGPMESRGSSSREMADDAIAFFEAHRAEKFFLWVHFYDPHLSYEPHAEVPSFGGGRMDLYDGEIRFTDLHIGRVMARLRELGLWDKTAVVVTGDHGEGFGEHGVTEHGFHLYSAQTKVPLIVRVPGLPARRIAAPAGHVDIAPTLLNLARAPQEPRFLGRSLVPELTGQRQEEGAGPAPPLFQEVTSERGKKRALVSEEWHLIWNWTPENTTECFNLRGDPGERNDLWGRSGADACDQMKRELQGMVSALSVPPEVAARLKKSVFGPGAAAPALAQPIDARLGDRVAIVASNPVPATSRPGTVVELQLLFESLKPVAEGWRFFFHVMGPEGMFRNLDHVPLDGVLPVEAWRKGQRILDKLEIALPPGMPPGDYQVIAGLYRGAERLPIVPVSASDGKSAARLATLHVR